MLLAFKSVITCINAYILIFAINSASASSSNINLPNLGDASAGIISLSQEYELGQKWLKYYRSQVLTASDPLIQDYLERLIRKIALHSELKDKRLEILVIDNPTLNAFAVPGGIIGIHTGLFAYAETEQQLASVVAHEIAHISQRHFARRLLDNKEKAIPTLAALFASILIAATSSGEAGLAAIAATQAASIDSQLRFSRQMEQEADRVAMDTLVRANMDPFAMPDMFEQMQRASRFQRRPPEFLLTHPLTESRISDSQLRAQQFRKKQYPLSLEFQLAKTRILLSRDTTGKSSLVKFQKEVDENNFSNSTAKYGLALANIKLKDTDAALTLIKELRKTDAYNIYYLIAEADALAISHRHDEAISLLADALVSRPSDHPINVRYAELLMEDGKYKVAEQVLVKHSERRPNDDYVWYLLAEVHGLTGDIFHVHTARAEYFLLNGLFDKAEIQIKNALKLVNNDKFVTARLEQKLNMIRRNKKEFQEI